MHSKVKEDPEEGFPAGAVKVKHGRFLAEKDKNIQLPCKTNKIITISDQPWAPLKSSSSANISNKATNIQPDISVSSLNTSTSIIVVPCRSEILSWMS